MRKIRFLFTGILIAAAITSCNDVNWDEVEDLNFAPTTFNKSKEYRGGNVDCSQLGMPGLVETTGRNNFNAGAFEFSWPEGLEVKVDEGKYVSFYIPESTIKIGDLCYKIGAVIVKGGDASNVYYYPGGATGDKKLAAPNNSSGGPAGLSNLTFCFIEVECEEPEQIVIAVKTSYWATYSNDVWSDFNWAVSQGNFMFPVDNWCDILGVNYFPETTSFGLHGMQGVMGTVTVEEAWPAGVHSLVVTIDMNDGLQLDLTRLYVGSLDGLLSTVEASGCPNYNYWPFQDETDQNTHVYTIPYDSLN